MSLSNYIPPGRTSLVKKNNASLQVQTEYAYRPYPRLTTTISNNGQVIHKIEKKLDKAIESFEEQSRMGEVINSQHREILDIIKEETFQNNVPVNNNTEITGDNIERAFEVAEKENAETNNIDSLSLTEKIKTLPGVKSIYHMDIEGNFHNKISGEQFKKSFSAIFKNLKGLLEIFSTVPGVTITRERGVYEIEQNKLYMLSAGDELYFVALENARPDINYESALKELIKSSNL